MNVVMLTRRDTLNPEGGGSEVYLESVARGLVARGHEVTIFCAEHSQGAEFDDFDGVKVIRRGSKTGVHLEALKALRSGEFGTPDVVVDVQNGMPFFSRLVARHVPCVVLVHHVHREQWPVVYGPMRARIGWFLESRVAPRFYRGCQYVTVSQDTKEELVELGVAGSDIEVIHNGTHDVASMSDTPTTAISAAPEPRIIVLGRLVPHKQVEHVFEAAVDLRRDLPGLTVAVVGDGWWSNRLQQSARDFGVDDIVEFTGFVDESEKNRQLSMAWVLAMPSLKEGWGIVIMEAARHGVSAVGYRSAGGVAESISDGVSGILVDGGAEGFKDALLTILTSPALRKELGEGARSRSSEFGWDQSIENFEKLLQKTIDSNK